MEERNKYIEENYKLWEKKYDIKFEDEFNVKLLLGLRYDILNTPVQHVLQKQGLLSMLNNIRCNLILDLKK